MLATQIYRCHISTINPYPDHALEVQWARFAWEEACENLAVNVAPTGVIIKLVTCLTLLGALCWVTDTSFTLQITKRTSQVRGELKTKVRPLVESLYGFENAKSSITRNRERAENLKDDYAFVYKVCGFALSPCTLPPYCIACFQKPALGEVSRELRKGMYQHPIIQKAINAMWFANKHDEGVRFFSYFNPVTIEALAFVLTAVCFMFTLWTHNGAMVLNCS